MIDAATGLPVTRIEEGVPMIVRGPALVETGERGDAVGLARKSRLTEIMFGETLMAGAEARTAHPNPPSTRAGPRDDAQRGRAARASPNGWTSAASTTTTRSTRSGVRTVATLSQATFEAQVLPVLQANCAAGCHQAGGSTGRRRPAPRSAATASCSPAMPEGDYDVTLSMISNTCNAASNYLLSRPSTVPHPARRDGADDRGAADRQRRLQRDRELDLDGMFDT